jgi:RHS repeat-associated protein
MLTSQTQPTSSSNSITASYGFDLAGNPTAVTDGNGNTTYATYNSLGLPQTIVEPTTAEYSSAADSTTTDIYDGDGDLVTQDLPGGVQISNTYDAMGDPTGQSGTGAAAPTATRTFTYDQAGRLLTAATSAAGTQGQPGYQPATSESFGYDDRGLLLSASGSAGTSTFTYNASAQLASATDAAGTSTYTYDSAGRLATDADAASGITGTYSYNSLDQVTQVSYGTGNDVQSYGYDNLHRLTSDTVTTTSGAQVAAIDYGYDANDDVTSMTTSGLATAGGGTGTVTNTYGYDEADRLTSWTATPAGGQTVTKTYGYDNAGNMISNNGTTYTYDARDELTANGSNTYSYTADGDLATQTGSGGTATFASNAYGQQITDAGSSYTWDARGRIISAANSSGGSTAVTYDGMTNLVASDSLATYSRDPSGALVGVDSGAGGQALALNDQHDDLSGTFDGAATALATSSTWDPWGNPIATSGPSVGLGYQGQLTDPATGQTEMGSRLYNPSTGGFINADTASAAGGNPYAYADDNPMSLTDPSGNSPSGGGTGNGTVTLAKVQAAAAQVADDEQTAARDQAAAAKARSAAAQAQSTASAAHALANDLNDAASQLRSQWEQANQAAQQAKAQAQTAYETYLQAEGAAEAAYNAIGPEPTAPPSSILSGSGAANDFTTGGSSSGGTTSIGFLCTPEDGCVAYQIQESGSGATGTGSSNTSTTSAAEQQYQDEMAAYDSREANYRKALATENGDRQAWQAAQEHATQLETAADQLWAKYSAMHDKAVAAEHQADTDTWLAGQAEGEARSLTAIAASAEKTLDQAEAAYEALVTEYDNEQRAGHQHTPKPRQKTQPGNGNPPQPGTGNSNPPAPASPADGCSAGAQLGFGAQHSLCRKAAVAAANAVQDAAGALGSLLSSGLNSISSCITHPTLASCAAAAVTAIFLIGTGFADAGADAAEATATADATEPTAGQTLYRVYGGDSKAGGASWSSVDPGSVPDFRDAAGLPSGGASGATNTGRFVIEGTLTDPSAVVLQRSALPLDGMKGGLPEYIIPNWLENGSVVIRRVSGVNPEF